MALHRDIYWVGKQWAVTGYGVQACDQKQKSKFDIEAGKVWDDDVLEGLRAQKWLNVEDLEKALVVARVRFPEPARKEVPTPHAAPPVALHAAAITNTDPEPPKFHMLFSGAGKFIRPWHVRMKK
jgi:hypothetical protein